MTIDDLTRTTGEWLRGTGAMSDVVISSRIRLARNVEGYPFLSTANVTQRTEIYRSITEAISCDPASDSALLVDVNAADQRGNTPLHDAARLGYNTIVQFLADEGADVNAKNTRGQTPLSLAEAQQPLTGNYNDNDHAITADLLRQLGARHEPDQ